MKLKHLPLLTLMLGCASAYGQATLLKDIYPGAGNGVFYVVGTAVMNDKLYFAAQDTALNMELWSTDGTTAGTAEIADIDPNGGSGPSRFHVFNNNVYFAAETPNEGTELYKTDGTTAGTAMIKDIWSGITGSWPGNFCNYNNKLFFTAEEPASGGMHHVIYTTDGTTANTSIVTTGPWTMGTMYFTQMNNKLYFNANSSIATTGIELWESDGTTANTTMVKDILAGASGSNPEYLTKFGTNKFIFSATDPATGYELYISDGTAAGTSMIKDIWTGTGNSYPSRFKEWNGKIYFIANDGVNGAEPWVTDGTAAGTMMLVNTDGVATNGATYSDFCVVNNKLLFGAKTATQGNELWETDGTTAGTKVFMDINQGAGTSVDQAFEDCVLDGLLYFVANDGTNGNEPWVTDGTVAGTKMLANICAGNKSSMWTSEYRFKKVKDKILFVANDSISGSEIWVIDAPVSVSNSIISAEDVVKVYPNPSTGAFYIKAQMAFTQAMITNVAGQVVYNGTISNNTIQLTNQPAGVYNITLTAPGGKLYHKQVQVLR